MATTPEGGLYPGRVEFVRENTTGQANSNPGWNRFSDRVRTVNWSFTPNVGIRRGINTTDPWDVDAFTPSGQSTEEHTATVTYDLQQGFISGSNPQDASDDGLERDSAGLFQNTHTVVDRNDRSDTSIGTASGGIREYFVGKGGYIDTVTVSGDPGSEDPVTVELTYNFEKVRMYQIDQPSTGTTVDVVSTDTGDTTQKVTIEDEGAATTETITLSGTTTQTGTATFSDIDAISLDSETTGDVTVTDGTNTLTVIRGSSNYDGVEGDLGVPALGTGSHASAIGNAFEEFIGDTVDFGGNQIDDVISSTEFSVSNNLSMESRHDSMRPDIQRGERVVEVTANVFGEQASFDNVERMLTATESNLKWTLTNGSLQADSARLTGPSDVSYEESQVRVTLDNTFTGTGVTVT